MLLLEGSMGLFRGESGLETLAKNVPQFGNCSVAIDYAKSLNTLCYQFGEDILKL
jgi:hypothetical protein